MVVFYADLVSVDIVVVVVVVPSLQADMVDIRALDVTDLFRDVFQIFLQFLSLEPRAAVRASGSSHEPPTVRRTTSVVFPVIIHNLFA